MTNIPKPVRAAEQSLDGGDITALIAHGRQLRAQAFNQALDALWLRMRHLVD